MSWEYSDLSKKAKEAGGPDEFVNTIKQEGKEEGREEMIPVVVGVGFLASLATWFYHKHKLKRAISRENADKATAELVKGINEYDAAHPEEHCEGNSTDEDDANTIEREETIDD